MGSAAFREGRRKARDVSMVHIFEALFFISIAAEILIPPIAVLLGLDSRRHRTLVPLAVDAAVFVTLTRMWMEVKKIHEKVAMVLLAASK